MRHLWNPPHKPCDTEVVGVLIFAMHDQNQLKDEGKEMRRERKK